WLILFSIASCGAAAQVRFLDAVPLAGAKSPNAALAADLNGDGKPDLVVLDNSASSVNVLLNRGAAKFSISRHSVPYGPATAKVADFNHDGIPDIAVTDSKGVSILLGMPNGKFSRAQTYPATPPNQLTTPFPN